MELATLDRRAELVVGASRVVRASRWRIAMLATRLSRQKWPVDPTQPLTRFAKLRLAVEIVGIYMPTRVRIAVNRPRLLEQVQSLATLDALGRPSECSGWQKTVDASRAGSAVTRTLDLLPTDSSCLTRSVVLARLLARRGIESSLVIAVAGEGSSFIAHAWVERDGVPLLDAGGDGMARLVEIDVVDDDERHRRPS